MEKTQEHGNAAAWAAAVIGIPSAIVAVVVIVQMMAGGTTNGSAPDVVAPVGNAATQQDTSSVRTVAPLADSELSDDVCQVEIANRLATIHEQPDVFAQEIVDVPPGVYDVERIENVKFGGVQEQRWLLITVSGRQGWLQDSTFNIAAKSAACP